MGFLSEKEGEIGGKMGNADSYKERGGKVTGGSNGFVWSDEVRTEDN